LRDSEEKSSVSETYREKKQIGTLGRGESGEISVPKRRISNRIPAKPFVRTLPSPTDRLRTENERQFVSSVQSGMEGPLLRYSKRLELMELADELNLSRFQANLLIAQVQQRTGRAEEILVRSAGQSENTTSASSSSTWRDRFILMGAVFILSALVDMILIRLFFSK
jgi:hypothetical protein